MSMLLMMPDFYQVSIRLGLIAKGHSSFNTTSVLYGTTHKHSYSQQKIVLWINSMILKRKCNSTWFIDAKFWLKNFSGNRHLRRISIWRQAVVGKMPWLCSHSEWLGIYSIFFSLEHLKKPTHIMNLICDETNTCQIVNCHHKACIQWMVLDITSLCLQWKKKLVRQCQKSYSLVLLSYPVLLEIKKQRQLTEHANEGDWMCI